MGTKSRYIYLALAIATLLVGFFLLRPFVFKKAVKALDLNASYPSSWYATLNKSAQGGFENLVISDNKEVVSMQQAIPPSARAEITVNLAPKEQFDNNLKYEVGLLSPKSKVTYQKIKIDGHDAVMAIIDGTDTDNYYSKEIILYIKTGKDYIYRVQGGALRNAKGLVAAYKFSLVERVLNSLSLSSEK